METIRKTGKAVVERGLCVACGCCVAVCPRNAIRIIKGVFANADESLCVGCGACVRICPASVISMEVRA